MTTTYSLAPDPIPRRPYTSTGASARTSLTWVDHSAEENMPSVEETNNDTNNDTAGSIIAAPVPTAAPQIPQTSITFLLVSGRRRTMSFDPETTIGRVKELVWNTWLGDWQDERPPAPSYLRILYLGKVLQDDDTLTKLGLPPHIPSPTQNADTNSNVNANIPLPTVVHLSIRLHDSALDDDGPPKKARCRVRNGDGVGLGSDGAGADGEMEGASWCGCCGCVIC